jgi:RNA polymerase sigma-70 factor (ECF subfamily)
LSEDERSLVGRCRAGDEAAWKELVARHARSVFGLAYRFVGRVDAAEDLTQEVFVRVYQALGRYREEQGAFRAWLLSVARNVAIDHYRKRREERLRVTGDPEVIETMATASEGPHRLLEKQEKAEIVRRGLRALPQELREPLVLYDLLGHPYEEVAVHLGIPLGTVKSRINRGRIELAKRLASRLGGEAARA